MKRIVRKIMLVLMSIVLLIGHTLSISSDDRGTNVSATEATYDLSDYKQTSELGVDDKGDEKQKNHQISYLEDAVYSEALSKAVEWTDKEAGEAEIKISYQLDETGTTRALYAYTQKLRFNEYYSSSDTYSAVDDIAYLLDQYDHVDIIQAYSHAAYEDEIVIGMRFFSLRAEDELTNDEIEAALYFCYGEWNYPKYYDTEHVYKIGSEGDELGSQHLWGRVDILSYASGGYSLYFEFDLFDTSECQDFLNEYAYTNVQYGTISSTYRFTTNWDESLLLYYGLIEYMNILIDKGIDGTLEKMYVTMDVFQSGGHIGSFKTNDFGYMDLYLMKEAAYTSHPVDSLITTLYSEKLGIDLFSESLDLSDMNDRAKRAINMLKEFEQNGDYIIFTTETSLSLNSLTLKQYILDSINDDADTHHDYYVGVYRLGINTSIIDYLFLSPTYVWDNVDDVKEQIEQWKMANIHVNSLDETYHTFTFDSINELGDTQVYDYKTSIAEIEEDEGDDSIDYVTITAIVASEFTVDTENINIYNFGADGSSFDYVCYTSDNADGTTTIEVEFSNLSDGHEWIAEIHIPLTLIGDEFATENDDFKEVMAADTVVDLALVDGTEIELDATVESTKLYKSLDNTTTTTDPDPTPDDPDDDTSTDTDGPSYIIPPMSTKQTAYYPLS